MTSVNHGCSFPTTPIRRICFTPPWGVGKSHRPQWTDANAPRVSGLSTTKWQTRDADPGSWLQLSPFPRPGRLWRRPLKFERVETSRGKARPSQSKHQERNAIRTALCSSISDGERETPPATADSQRRPHGSLRARQGACPRYATCRALHLRPFCCCEIKRPFSALPVANQRRKKNLHRPLRDTTQAAGSRGTFVRLESGSSEADVLAAPPALPLRVHGLRPTSPS